MFLMYPLNPEISSQMKLEQNMSNLVGFPQKTMEELQSPVTLFVTWILTVENGSQLAPPPHLTLLPQDSSPDIFTNLKFQQLIKKVNQNHALQEIQSWQKTLTDRPASLASQRLLILTTNQ